VIEAETGSHLPAALDEVSSSADSMMAGNPMAIGGLVRPWPTMAIVMKSASTDIRSVMSAFRLRRGRKRAA